MQEQLEGRKVYLGSQIWRGFRPAEQGMHRLSRSWWWKYAVEVSHILAD